MKVVLHRFYTYKFSLLRGHGFTSDLSSCSGGLHDKFMVGGGPVQFCHPMFGEILEGPIISDPTMNQNLSKKSVILEPGALLVPFFRLDCRKTTPFAAALHIWQLSPGCEVKKGV